MCVITSIQPQKNKRNVNVYLDGRFGFGIDLVNFVKLGIKIGQDVSEAKILDIIKKSEKQKALDKLLRFATLRPRSQKEIESWLGKYKVHQSMRDEFLAKLRHLELLDDKKFTQWWVEQRRNFRHFGDKLIKMELIWKGVDKSIINDVFEGNKDSNDQKSDAMLILSRKLQHLRKVPREKMYRKLFGFLQRKGFDYEVIKQAIDELLLKE